MPVTQKVKSISLSNATVELEKPQRLQKSVQPIASLINSEVTYSSSDESIVTVDEFGVVTGHSEGKAVITAKMGELSATAEVSVKDSKSPTEPDNTKPTKSEEPSSENNSGGQTIGTQSTDPTSASQSISSDGGTVQTGAASIAAVILVLLLSAAAVYYFVSKKKFKGDK